MQLHAPHFNRRQRALLRNVLGALVAILCVAILIGLMAFLLVFPGNAFGLEAAPMLQREPTALSDLIPPYLRQLSKNKAE